MLLAICSASAGCASSVEDSQASTTPPGAVASPLEGEWVSDPIPAADIRAVVLAAGFTREDAEQVLGKTRLFEFTLRFENGRFTLLSTWDGKEVGELESGTYRQFEGDQLRLGIGDTGDSLLFAFDLQGERLTLSLLSNAETGTAEQKYTHSFFTMAYYTGHPFTKTA